MSHGYDRRLQKPRIVVRETDDYVERGRADREQGEGAPPERQSPWSRNLLQPAVVTILIACVVWPVAQFVPLFAPDLDRTLLWLGPVLMALVGFTTQRRVLQRLLSGTEAARFRLIELGVLFLLVKLASHLDNTMSEMAAIVGGWAREPMSFFDGETAVAFLIGAAAWWAAGATARDMEALSDPSMYIGETGPRVRLMNRYFLGGAVLMLFAALARVSLLDVITLSQARSRRPVVSALIYFLVGLAGLGVVRFTRLLRLWRRDRVLVTDELRPMWLRYLLVFLALVSAVAFMLPTGYTIGILDLVATVIAILSFLLLLLYTLLMWPFAALLRLLFGEGETPSPPSFEQLPFQPEVVPPAGGRGPFWEILQSVLFWVVLLGVIVYLLRSYLRDRPDLWELAQRIRPRRWAVEAWRALRNALRRWWAKIGRAVQAALPALAERLQRRREQTIVRREAGAGPTPREQVLYHYLRALAQARAEGYPRRGPETPYEYAHTLAPHVAEDAPALAALTEAFIEARYSEHLITSQDVAAQRANADRVIRALEERDAEGDERH